MNIIFFFWSSKSIRVGLKAVQILMFWLKDDVGSFITTEIFKAIGQFNQKSRNEEG